MKDIKVELSKKKADLSPTEINSEIQAEMFEESLKKKAESSGGQFDYVDLRKFPLNSDIFGLMEIEKLKRYQVAPYFRVGRKINLAVIDPYSDETRKIID